MYSAFFCYLISSWLCIKAAKTIEPNSKIIIDFIHTRTDPIPSRYTSDVLVLCQGIYTLCYFTRQDLVESFWIMSLIQCFRALCSLSTALPALKAYNEKERLWGINGTGTEYIFSGHASYSALCTIYLYKNKLVNNMTLFLYNIFSQYLIIATRNHYSVDVVLAWIIVPLTYFSTKYFLTL
jgi:hypothetical protein